MGTCIVIGVKRRPFWLKELSPEAFGYFFAPKACLGVSVGCNGFANVFTNAFGQLFFCSHCLERPNAAGKAEAEIVGANGIL